MKRLELENLIENIIREQLNIHEDSLIEPEKVEKPDEVDEMSTTGAVAGYETPGAFSKTTSDKIATQAGYSVVGKKEKADNIGPGARKLTVRRNFAESVKLSDFYGIKKLNEFKVQNLRDITDLLNAKGHKNIKSKVEGNNIVFYSGNNVVGIYDKKAKDFTLTK